MSETPDKKTFALFRHSRNRQIFTDLKNVEHVVIEFPESTFQKISFDEKTRDLLKNLSYFNWLVFPDVSTVDFFLETLREIDFDLFELDNLNICAFGEAVADRLRFSQLHADVVPIKVFADEVFEALKAYILDVSEFERLRFLVFADKSSLSDKLRLQGAEVVEIQLYEQKFSNVENFSKLKAYLLGGTIDEFIFTSLEDIPTLCSMFQTENLEKLFHDIKITCTEPVIFQQLLEFSLKPTFYKR